MLCPNNFAIIGGGENNLGLADKISKLTGLKVQEEILASAKIKSCCLSPLNIPTMTKLLLHIV
jgi:hypothetical protein